MTTPGERLWASYFLSLADHFQVELSADQRGAVRVRCEGTLPEPVSPLMRR